MEILIQMLIVLGLGALELWAAIPTGFVLRFNPLVTAVTATIGAILSVLVVLALGERIRSKLLRKQSEESKVEQHGRIYRIWIRFGVVGLGLLAPLLVGAPLGTAIGVTIGAPPGRLLLWVSLGIVLWSALLTLAVALGIASIEALQY